MRTCVQCDQPLPLKPTSVNRKFCNRSCAATYNNRASPKRQKEGRCPECETPVSFSRKRYCSPSCRKQAKQKRLAERRRLNPIILPQEHVVSWRQRTKLKAVAAKGGKCMLCGYSKSIRAMTFHHINPTTKEFEVSGSTKSWAKILIEMEKCVLLCANCHAECHDGLHPHPPWFSTS